MKMQSVGIKNSFAHSVVVLWGMAELPKPGLLMSFEMPQAIQDGHTALADVSTEASVPFCLTHTFQSKMPYPEPNYIGYRCGGLDESLL